MKKSCPIMTAYYKSLNITVKRHGGLLPSVSLSKIVGFTNFQMKLLGTTGKGIEEYSQELTAKKISDKKYYQLERGKRRFIRINDKVVWTYQVSDSYVVFKYHGNHYIAPIETGFRKFKTDVQEELIKKLYYLDGEHYDLEPINKPKNLKQHPRKSFKIFNGGGKSAYQIEEFFYVFKHNGGYYLAPHKMLERQHLLFLSIEDIEEYNQLRNNINTFEFWRTHGLQDVKSGKVYTMQLPPKGFKSGAKPPRTERVGYILINGVIRKEIRQYSHEGETLLSYHTVLFLGLRP
jgi:hypothetical protein